MTDSEKVKLVAEIMTTHGQNRDDEDGDKFLADVELAYEAMESVILDDDPRPARRDGFIQ